MSYKRVVKKKGKDYGPYLYESYRDKDGKVKKRYLGKHVEQQKNLKKTLVFLSIALLVLVNVFIFSVAFSEDARDVVGNVVRSVGGFGGDVDGITGNAHLDVGRFLFGDNPDGVLGINVKRGELIPADTKIVVEQLGETREYLLSDVVEMNSNGDYYVEGVDVSGSGDGYGFEGIKTIYPNVYFTLLLSGGSYSSSGDDSSDSSSSSDSSVDVSENASEGSEDVNEGDENASEINSDEEGNGSESIMDEEEVNEESEEIVEEESSSEESGEVNDEESNDSESLVTGAVISSVDCGDLEEGEECEVEGFANYEGDFEYNINNGMSASIKPGSIYSANVTDVDFLFLEIDVSDEKVVVSTDYSVNTSGFGEDYIIEDESDDESELEIDLSLIGIEITESNFSVRLIYDGEVLDDVSGSIDSSGVVVVDSLENEEGESQSVVGVNQTVLNETNITTVNASSLSEETKQYKAVIGRPVKWLKKVKVNESNKGNVTVNIPKKAQNITVKVGGEVGDAERELEEYDAIVEESDREEIVSGLMTGNVVLEVKKKKGLFTRIWEWFEDLDLKLTGNVVGNVILEEEINDSVIETETEKVVNLTDVADEALNESVSLGVNETEIVVEYYTDAPQANESIYNNGDRKRVVVYADDELNYTEILAYSLLDDLNYSLSVNETFKLKLYWYADEEKDLNGSELESLEINEVIDGSLNVSNSLGGNISSVDYDAYDLDEDGFIDYIEWVVPHLSVQSYEIVISSSTSLGVSGDVVFDGRYSHLAIDSSTIPYDSLIGYWSFDSDEENTEGFTAYDFSPNENDGSAGGNAVVNDTNCPFGNCLHLDGTDDYITTDVSINFTEPFTLSAWIRNDKLTWQSAIGYRGGSYPYLINDRGATTVPRGLFSYQKTDDSYNHCWYNFPGVAYGSSDPIENWVHIVVSSDGENVTIYGNAGVVDSDCTISDPKIVDVGISLGAVGTDSGSGRDWNGTIDEVMIFNTSLNSTQVGELYNNQSSRFVSSGIQDVKQFNISSGQQSVNLSLQETIEELGSNVQARVGYWNVNEGYNENDFDGENGLVAYYHFDEDAWTTSADEVVDSSGNGNHGTSTGNANTTNSGNYPFGRVGSFDGNGDHIDIAYDDSLNISMLNNWTFSMWLYPLTWVAGDGTDDIGLITSNSRSGFLIWSNGTTFMYFGENLQNGYYSDANLDDIPINEWTHLVVNYEYDGTNAIFTVYQNGVLDLDHVTTDEGIWIADGILTIGRDAFYTANQRHFNGSIDEVMIFNRSLSEDEIKELYVKGRADWIYSDWEDYSEGVEFLIDSSSTNILPSLKLIAGDNNFYSPLVNAEVSYTTNLSVFGSGAPSLDIFSPENATYTSPSVLLNVSSDSEGEGMIISNLDNSLVSWWRMDDLTGSTVEDYLGTNDGTVVNDAAQTTSGKFGDGISLDGSGDYVNVGSPDSLDLVNNFSIFMWMKREGDSAGAYEGLYGRATEMAFMLYPGGYLRVYANNGTGGEAFRCSSSLEDGLWHSVGIVYNGSVWTAYLDGEEDCTGTGVKGDLVATQNHFIGYYTGNTNSYFNGTIDEVMVFNKTLSGEEALALYNATALEFNKTLENGAHTYKAYAQDYAGNVNESDEVVFSVNIDEGDVTAPKIDFVGDTPSDDSTIEVDNFVVNMSTSDDSEHFAFVDFDNSIVAWWRMDDVNATGDVVDYFGNYNGTAEEDAIQTTSGRFGDGFYFDGDADYVQMDSSLDPMLADVNLTISIWVKMDAELASKHMPIIGSKSGTDGLAISYYSGVRFYFIVERDNVQDSLYMNHDLTPGEWYHVAFTWVDGVGNASYYINGTHLESDIAPNVKHIPEGGDFFALGREGTHWLEMFNGTMDEVMIFNRTLSDEEIAAIYNATASQYYNSFTELENGEHNITGYAVDASGNVNSTSELNVNVNVDSTEPTITINSPENGTNVNSDFTSNASVSDDSGGNTFGMLDYGDSLISWYRMDDVNASGDVIDYMGRNNGTVVNDAIQNSSGVFGNAFEFDGSGDYINLGSDPSLDFCSGGYAISAWFNLDVHTGQYGVLGSSAGWNWGPHLYLRTDINKDISFGFDSSPYRIGDFDAGEWVHVVGVYNTTHFLIYKDGILLGSQAEGTSCVDFGENDAYLAYAPGISAPTSIDGLLDEVMIFNRTLSSDEVLALYNSSANDIYETVDVDYLSEGSNDLTFYASDESGNVNSSVVSVDLDITVPSLDIFSPENITYSESDVLINVSSDSEGEGMIVSNLDNSIVAWWRMDDVDESGNPNDYFGNYNGTISGIATQDSDGKFGDSIYFNGSVGNHITTNAIIPQSGSMSFWLYPEGSQTGRPVGPDYHLINYYYGGANSRMKLDTYNGSSYTSLYSSVGSVPESQWTHVILVWNSSGKFVYINGDYDNGNTDRDDTLTTTASKINMGAKTTGTTNPYLGKLDEVVVFNRSLGADEARTIYNATALEFNKTLENGAHTYKAYAQDYAGNVNESSLVEFTVDVDTTSPTIDFVGDTPSDDSTIEVDNFVVNMSTSDDSEHFAFVDFDNSIVAWWRMDDVDESEGGYESSSTSVGCWNDGGGVGTIGIDTLGMLSGESSITFTSGPNAGETYDILGCVEDACYGVYPEWYDPADCCTLDGFTGCSDTPDTSYNYNFGWGSLVAGDNITVDYMGRNNGTVNGDAVQTTSGKFGDGFEFDGNDDYIVSDSFDEFNMTGKNVTISAWAKYGGYTADWNGIAGIIDKDGAGTLEGYGIYAYRDDAGFRLYNLTEYVCDFRENIDNLVVGEWHHFVGVFNGTGITFYTDGSIQGTTDCGSDFGAIKLSGTRNFYVGSMASNPTSYEFNGSIDEVMVFNRSLSSDEVLALYNATANQYYNSFTELSDGGHTVTGYAVDEKGYVNSTSELSITVSTVGDPNTNRFAITNSSGSEVAFIDDKGELYLKGTISQSQSSLSAPTNSFIIQNSTGDDVAYFDSDGNLYLLGTVTRNADLTNSVSTKFEIRNSTDDIVAFIDSEGNMELQGGYGENYLS